MYDVRHKGDSNRKKHCFGRLVDDGIISRAIRPVMENMRIARGARDHKGLIPSMQGYHAKIERTKLADLPQDGLCQC
jgi:hypothetical protein